MLESIGILLLMGLIAGGVVKKLKLPPLLGMIFVGILVGPYMFNILDEKVLMISKEIRQIALVVILLRAGLSLDIKELKKIGRPALLLCFVPAVFEMVGVILLAPPLLHVSILEAALMGSVLAAVSPAVVVPKMLKLMEEGYGTKQAIPQMILAGASVDDVFVIVIFTSLLNMNMGSTFNLATLSAIPVSIIVGIGFGILVGVILNSVFKISRLTLMHQSVILLALALMILSLETKLSTIIPISGLLAVMAMAATLYHKNQVLAKNLSEPFKQLWIPFEIFLFTLVGASVDVSFAMKAGISVVVLIFGALVFRMIGVYVSLLKTPLNQNERLFSMIAYTPKATVQAAIGSIPLSMQLSSGSIILTAAVVSILLTAPLGAFMIEWTYKKLLTQET